MFIINEFTLLSIKHSELFYKIIVKYKVLIK
jgi:hypothetical protein